MPTPNEGIQYFLRCAVEKPMLLYVFSGEPKTRDPELVSAESFTFSTGTEPALVEKKDWLIDQEKLNAVCDERMFIFKKSGFDVSGWVLLTKSERVVVGYKVFAKPYPINTTADKVGVRARIVFTPQGEGS